MNITTTNGTKWMPRKMETLTCPSGVKVTVKRPGPEFTLRSGRFVGIIPERKRREGESVDDYNARFYSEMSDTERAAVVDFARELVCAMVMSPRLKLNPGPDEVGPDDIGDDLWYLYGHAMRTYYGKAVQVGNDENDSEEVGVADLETFRDESGISGDSVGGVHVSPNAEPDVANPGLVGVDGN